MRQGIQKLCSSVQIDGRVYEINTDFKVWIEIEHLFFDRSKRDGQRLAEILALAYPVLPENPMEAVYGIMWFYSAGERNKGEGERDMLPSYDLTEDFDYVWGAFLGEFGIDLTEISMHWWKFRALLGCLSEECRFSKIVGYRTMDTSRIKDKELRRFYEKMKKRFRLKAAFDEKVREQQLEDSLEGLF